MTMKKALASEAITVTLTPEDFDWVPPMANLPEGTVLATLTLKTGVVKNALREDPNCDIFSLSTILKTTLVTAKAGAMEQLKDWLQPEIDAYWQQQEEKENETDEDH
jgi:hypothetical protein